MKEKASPEEENPRKKRVEAAGKKSGRGGGGQTELKSSRVGATHFSSASVRSPQNLAYKGADAELEVEAFSLVWSGLVVIGRNSNNE